MQKKTGKKTGVSLQEENRCQFVFSEKKTGVSLFFQGKNELTSRQESSGKEDSWKLETFQMEPCG